jgi:hypothetical protein
MRSADATQLEPLWLNATVAPVSYVTVATWFGDVPVIAKLIP